MSAITCTITCGGKKLEPQYDIYSMDIRKTVNRIPAARLVILDGDAAEQEFQLSDSGFFMPGKEVKIKLRHEGEDGPAGSDQTVFKGIVVKQGIRVGRSGSFLTADMKDKAFGLTVSRKSYVFKKGDDSDFIKQVIGKSKSGVKVKKVGGMKAMHDEMVRYYSTDWDFILSRAEANGCQVMADDGKMTVGRLKPGAGKKHKFTYGIDPIYDFEMEADITAQHKDIKAKAWDVAGRKMVKSKKAAPVKLSQGKFKPEAGARAMGAEKERLIHPAFAEKDEIDAWAEAEMIKTRMSMLKGRFSIEGDASIKMGDTAEIKGAGKSFNGKAVITGIRHRLTAGVWRTDVQFGVSADWFAKKADVTDAPAAGLVPAIHGLHVGIVDAFQEDPRKLFRVKVIVPGIHEKEGVVWARLASPDAGKKRGIFFRPEKGDEVILGFINDDPRHAVILGSVHSPKNALPPGFKITAKNEKKGMLTKEKLKIELDDKDKIIEISTPGGNILKISDKDKGFKLKDQNGNILELNDKGVKMKTEKNIVMEGKDVKIKGTGNITLDGKAVKVKSSGKIDVNGTGKIKVKGSGKIGIKGSGDVDIQGGKVNVKGSAINMK